ncbi:MAG: hypothetical protein WBY94_28320 [Polyangiaceae bacterium]
MNTKLPMTIFTAAPAFPIGDVYVTSGAAERFPSAQIAACLNRHIRCDWGNVSADDAKLNTDCAKAGAGQLHSAYALDADLDLAAGRPVRRTLWVITDHDRTGTTVLLPDEY